MQSIRTIPLKAGATPGIAYEVIQLHQRAGAIVGAGDAIATLRADGISFVIETTIAGEITDDLVPAGAIVDGGGTICNIAVSQAADTIPVVEQGEDVAGTAATAVPVDPFTVQMQFGVNVGPDNFLKILNFHKKAGDLFEPDERLVTCYVKANGGVLSNWTAQGIHETTFSMIATCRGIIDTCHLHNGSIARESVIMLTARIEEGDDPYQHEHTRIIYHSVNQGERIANETDIPYGISLRQQHLQGHDDTADAPAAIFALQSWRSREPRAHTVEYETLALAALGLTHPDHYQPARDICIGRLRPADCPAALDTIVSERNRRFGKTWVRQHFQQTLNAEPGTTTVSQAGDLFSAEERRRWYARSTVMSYPHFHECVGHLIRLNERVDILKGNETSDEDWWLAQHFDDARYSQDQAGYLAYLEHFHPAVFQFACDWLPVVLARTRLRHPVCIDSGPGSGKSELLKQLIADQIRSEQSAIVVFDTRGKVAGEIARWRYFAPDNTPYCERLMYLKAGITQGRRALADIDLEALIEQRKVLLFDLTADAVEAGSAAALEHRLLTQLRALAMRRRHLPADQRIPVHIYIDEDFADITADITADIGAMVEKPETLHIYLTLCRQRPAADRSSAAEPTLPALTGTRFIGYHDDAGRYQRLSEATRTPLAMFENLQRFQWLILHSENESGHHGYAPFSMTLHTDMLDKRSAMSNPAWQQVLERQLAHYYRTDTDQATAVCSEEQ